MKSFSMVVVGLVLVALIIVFISNSFNSPGDATDNPSQARLARERIKPVADAYTGTEGPSVKGQAGASATPAAALAYDGSLDGEMLFTKVCSACHATGAAGAPKPGSPEMAQRLEKGTDALVQSAINGLNAMPPKGGRPDLSDEQIKAIIEFMSK